MPDPSQQPAAASTPPPSVEDRLLLRRHLDGDGGAFPTLIARHGALVYGLLGRCGLRPEERDDVFQEVWLRVHRAAPSYEPGRPLRPWLATVAMNTARTYFRRGRTAEIVAPDPGDGVPAKTPSAPQSAEGRELADWLRAAIDALPEAERHAVHLCCVEGLSQADVADTLGLPVNTVKTHLRRGRLALADALARRRAAEEREVG